MSNDEITMEQIAEMVQKGFEQTSAEIKSVDSRVSSLDDKVNKLEDEFKEVKGSLKELKEEVFEMKGSMEYGFRSVNDKLDDLNESLGEPPVHRNEHDDLVSRVKSPAATQTPPLVATPNSPT